MAGSTKTELLPGGPHGWDTVITPARRLFDLRLAEVWHGRDLLLMLLKRDVSVLYKQTLLGPAWYLIQPVIMVTIYVLIFSRLARIPTDGLPPVVFYLIGIIVWNYFAECFTQTSDTFFQNAAVFGKVYFPRLLVPMARAMSGMIKFGIQFLLFLVVYIFYLGGEFNLDPGPLVLLAPLLLLQMSVLGLGMGLIVTSITTRYRDLKFVIGFGVQILMYMTPVIYPASLVPDRFRLLIFWNPMAHIIEVFRLAFLGTGTVTITGVLYSIIVTLMIFMSGVILFNRIEQDFIDTV